MTLQLWPPPSHVLGDSLENWRRTSVGPVWRSNHPSHAESQWWRECSLTWDSSLEVIQSPMAASQKPWKVVWSKLEGQRPSDNTQLPGKLKTWCLQFGLLPRVLWPLAVYEVPTSTVEKMERGVTAYIKKWLGVPRCLITIGLYGDAVMELPLTSLSEEFKCAKTRLQMTLNKSKDLVVRNNAPTLATGRKWRWATAVEATSAFRHADIVGHVQQGMFSMFSRLWYNN